MRPAKTFITTDWHLFHDFIIKSGERPANYQELLIENHIKMVNPQDTLINLGDVIFYHSDQLVNILAKINCTKILVMGNHDHKSKHWYTKNGFHYVADMIVLNKVLFSHRPVNVLPDGVEFNVHGHLHTHRHANKQLFHRLLALEYTDYCPVLLSDLVKQ